MANPWETPPPQTAPLHDVMPWETDAPKEPQADNAPLDKYLQNAPGMREAQNPMDAFFAGLQLSSSSLLTGKPDLTLPANSSFMMKLTAGVGQGLGDLPFNIIGGASGAAAGGGVTAESGGWGAIPGAGAGGMALPEAVRQVMLDRYQSGANRTWAEFAHDVATRSWEVGKAGFTGAVVGPLASKGGTFVESATGSAFAKTATTVTTYGIGATGVQSTLNGHVPDAQDFAIGMINAVGFHVAGTYVGGKFMPSETGQRVQKNMEEIYRSTGVPPWQQAEMAKRDPKLRDEILAQDVNGEPVATKFNADRPPDPEGWKTNAFKVQAEHDQQMQDIHGSAYRATAIDGLLTKVRGLERSGDDAISPAGAVGRYQIMPGTARQYGFDPSKLTDPAYNEKVARVVLNDLHQRFKGDEEAILIAYNAGPRRAISFVNNGRDQSELPRETQGYLARAGFTGEGGQGGGGKPPGKGVGQAAEEPPAGPNGPDFSKMTTESRLSRFMDAVGEEPAKKGIWSMSRLTRQWVSELQTAREIDGEMVKQGLLEPNKQLTTEDMFRQTYASDSRASHFFYRGAIDPITFDQKPGPSLNDVINEVHRVGGNIDEFNMYRVAQRTIEKSKQGIDTGVFKGGVAEAAVNANDPALQKYKAVNDMMQQWKLGGLEYGRDSGLFSQGQVDAMQRANTSHVSLRRIMGDDKSFQQGAFGRTFRVRNPLKLMEGSDKQIIQPLTADMDNLRQIVAMADRNRAIGHLVGSADARGILGLVKQVTGPEEKAMLAEPGSNVFKPYGMTDAEAKAFAPFVAKAKQGGLKGTQFTFYRNGKPEVWEARSEEVAQLMRGADSPGEVNLILKLASWPAKMMRTGTVFMPDFALRVGIANELSAFILDPSHPTPFLTFARGAMEPWKKSDTFWEWVRHGGGGVALRDLDQTYVTRDFQKILDDTNADNGMWNAVKHPIELAQIINERLDTAPRIGVYKSELRKGTDKTKAAMISRRASLDYAERGTSEFANIMSKTIPFFRASMLGLAQASRARNDLLGVGIRIGMASIAPAVMLWALNHEADKHLDEADRYSSINRGLRDMYFVTPPIGGIRFKMRRPFQIGFTGALIDRFLDAEIERDPHAMDDWAQTIIKDNLPPLVPTAVAPLIEGLSNHNFYSGLPLIPDSLKDATSDMQYTDYTSQLARNISSALGAHTGMGIAEISPIIMDNYVREWGGSLGAQVLNALNIPLGKEPVKPGFDVADLPFVSGFVLRHPNMSSQVVTNFYDEADKFEALHKDKVIEVKQGNMEQAEKDYVNGGNKVVTIERIKHALAVQRVALKAIMKNDKMSTDDKRQLSERIYNDAIAISTFGSRILKGDIPSNEEIGSMGERLQGNIEASGLGEQQAP